MELAPADPRDEDAQRLMGALHVEEALLYHDLGPADPFDTFRPEDVLASRSVFVIARLEGEPMGCGALRPLDAHAAEINRMYVVPAGRRRGVARAILRELECRAKEFGYRAICLETGNRQLAAIKLYEGFGFRRTVPFGSHTDDPVSLFFKKDLPKVGAGSR